MAKINLWVVARFSNIDPSPRPQPLLAFARFFRRWQVRDGYVNLAVADEDLFDDGFQVFIVILGADIPRQIFQRFLSVG